MNHPTSTELQDFEVEVQRVAWGNLTIKVRAATLHEAQQMALDEAGNHVFSEKDSEYVLVDAPAPQIEDESGEPPSWLALRQR